MVDSFHVQDNFSNRRPAAFSMDGSWSLTKPLWSTDRLIASTNWEGQPAYDSSSATSTSWTSVFGEHQAGTLVIGDALFF